MKQPTSATSKRDSDATVVIAGPARAAALASNNSVVATPDTAIDDTAVQDAALARTASSGDQPPQLSSASAAALAAQARAASHSPSRPSGARPWSASDSLAQGKDVLPREGTRIQQYELIRELGRGGMGAVFLARDTRLGRRVAIKLLHSVSREITERFMLEARATAQLSHENIVVIHEIGEHDGHPFMVLELLEGVPLTTLMEKGKKLPYTRAVEIVVPVARALVRAHEANIVHRDLKPDNVFVTDSGTIKVLDFGIAKLLHQSDESEREPARPPLELSDPEESTELTRRGAIVGTMAYMSPEQWGVGTVDHRTDIWAVGILLWRMIAGKHPLHPLKGHDLVATARLDRPMPRVHEVCPDIPDTLATIIDSCLRKTKHLRLGSARDLLGHLETLLPGRYTRTLKADETPYAGLSAFQESDSDRFFGRAREIAAMMARLRDQPFIGVVGPSGAGKSSFVRAGVVPALKQSGDAWEALVIRPGRHPLGALATIVAPLVGISTSVSVADDLTQYQHALETLQTEPGYLGAVLRSRARRNRCRILVFVDQFEELYTLVSNADERILFTRCLAGVADDATAPLRLVISIRSDFLDRVAEDQRFLGELARGIFFLPLPSREGLRDAIVQPAEMAGFQFETPSIVEDVLDNLASTQGALPLLQFTASRLWEARDAQRRRLTEQGYRSIGGIVGALASHADSVLAELSPQARGLVRAIVLRLVTPERTRAIASVEELLELERDPDELHRLVNHLVQARLLTVQTSDTTSAASGPSVEIVHESLVHSWPLLRRWLDENQDDAVFLEQLRNAARQWEARNRPSGLLWRGEAMDEAQRWRRRYHGELPRIHQEYLDAVFALGARATRIRRYAVIASFALLSLLLVAGVVALLQIRAANQEALAQAEAARKAEHTARTAEQQVRQQLTVIQEEERARRKAEESARAAQRRAEAASKAVQARSEELALANEKLRSALAQATDATWRASQARQQAEEQEAQARAAEALARLAEAQALEANAKLEALLERERERAKRLESQIGSPIILKLR